MTDENLNKLTNITVEDAFFIHQDREILIITIKKLVDITKELVNRELQRNTPQVPQ